MKPDSLYQSNPGMMGNLKLIGQTGIPSNSTSQDNNPFHETVGGSSFLVRNNPRKIDGRILGFKST
jgi:hypothetical protein